MNPTDDRRDENKDGQRTRKRPLSSSDSAYSKEFAEAVGRTIKVIRTDLGIERRDLAARVGISYSYLTEIENGNKPASATVLGPLAEALGLRLSQLTEAAEMRLDARMESPLPGATMTEPAYGVTPDDQTSHRRSYQPPRHRMTASGPPQSALPEIPLELARGQQWAMQPSLRGQDRDLRSAILELERLLRRLAPDDIERLLDYARRLARP